jgi:GntR family transcriptional regulator / MocR family aminotransferase
MNSGPIFARMPLVRSDDEPLYRQIYERIRGSVLTGKFTPGLRLPSARTLSDRLGVARGTVEMAYQLLASEGYTVSKGAGGTFTAPMSSNQVRPDWMPRKSRSEILPIASEKTAASALPELFPIGRPAIDAFPRKLWVRLTVRAARSLSLDSLATHDPRGSERLRLAICAYLRISRDIDCDSDQIFITAGYQGALGLIAHLLMSADDRVWVEDPGYFLAYRALKQLAVGLIAVPVDEEGIDVRAGIARAPDAKFAVITPSHQFPTGVTLSISRRLALLDWAIASKSWIIEDDYDSEFHYQGRPLPALKSLDDADRVLFVGTFSKVLHPSLRMGYLVVPRILAETFRNGCGTLHPASGVLEQAVVSEFIDKGHFSRHIRRMKLLYAKRREAVVEAVQRHCGKWMRFDLRAGGMHVIAHLIGGIDADMLRKKAATRGIRLTPLSMAAVESSLGPGLLLGFATIPVAEADGAARRLRRICLMAVHASKG